MNSVEIWTRRLTTSAQMGGDVVLKAADISFGTLIGPMLMLKSMDIATTCGCL